MVLVCYTRKDALFQLSDILNGFSSGKGEEQEQRQNQQQREKLFQNKRTEPPLSSLCLSRTL